MAMASMLSVSSDMYGATLLPSNKPRGDKRTSNEKKKCKSCVCCKKNSVGKYKCSHNPYMKPLDYACEYYSKRKK